MKRRRETSSASPSSSKAPPRPFLRPVVLQKLLKLLRAKSIGDEGVVVAEEGKQSEQIVKFLQQVFAERSAFLWVQPEEPSEPVAWGHDIQGPVYACFILGRDASLPEQVRARQELLTPETLRVCIEHTVRKLSEGRSDTGIRFERAALVQATEAALFPVLEELPGLDMEEARARAASLWDEALRQLWHFHCGGSPFVTTAYRGRHDELFHSLLCRDQQRFFRLPPVDFQGTEEQRRVGAAVLEHVQAKGWGVLSGCGGSGKSFLLGQVYAAIRGLEVPSSDLRRLTSCPLCGSCLEEKCDCGFQKPQQERRSLQIAFCAPTNRAVAVLQKVLGSEAELCCTLHSLSCRRMTGPLDLLVVDEASMLSQDHTAILARCKALKKAALLFVGDHLQLPPVGPGEVFRPMLQRARLPFLTTNMRASEDLAAAVLQIRDGHSSRALAYSRVAEDLPQCFAQIYERRLRAEGSFQVLAMRNEERLLFCKFAVKKHHAPPGDDYASGKAAPFRFVPYPGLPVRFCTNRYKPAACKGVLGRVQAASLVAQTDATEEPAPFASDGAIVPGARRLPGGRAVWDVAVELEEQEGRLVQVKAGPAFLPFELRPAFAITVHDAQGGEFDEVHVILPPSEKSPLCSLEMLYTAASRARRALVIWSVRLPFEAFEGPMGCVSRPRISVLGELLKAS